MNAILEALAAPLTETYFQKALIGGGVVAIVCGVVGCLVILRRMAFLGDALSHAMIAGVAGGYLVMKLAFGFEAHAPGMLLGSLIAAVMTVALIGLVARVSRIKDDTAIGIMYTGIFAGGVLLVSVFRRYIHIDLMHFIMGDVLGITDTDLWMAVLVAATVLSVIALFFRHFQVASFDPIMAASIGMPLLLIDYALTTCVSLVVVSAVSMVGVILVVGLLITPAATAYLLSDRLQRMMLLAAGFGLSSVVFGLYLSWWIDSAGGGAIMVAATVQFLIVLTVAPRYGLLAGWQRRRTTVPQWLQEDILGSILRNDGPMTMLQLLGYIDTDRPRLKRAVERLTQQGLLEARGEAVALSEKGEQQATMLRRAHRLWEVYMHQAGTPLDELHSHAHELEHVYDDTAIEYLDDKLGHPWADPHGAEIPVAPEIVNADRPVMVSQLRESTKATIYAIDDPAGGLPLKVGMEISIGPRPGDDVWLVIDPDGNEIPLDHAQADAVHARVR